MGGHKSEVQRLQGMSAAQQCFLTHPARCIALWLVNKILSSAHTDRQQMWYSVDIACVFLDEEASCN